MVLMTSFSDMPCFSDFFAMIDFSLFVFVNPGRILFTVIPYSPNSKDKVFAQFATAALMVLETPNPAIGALTEVEIMLTIHP